MDGGGFSSDVGIFQPGASVEEDDAIAGTKEFGLEEMVVGGGGGGAFGAEEEAFLLGPVFEGGENLFVGQGDRGAAGFAKDIEHDVVAVGLGHAQASSESGGVCPHLADAFVLFEGANDGSATGGLHSDHAGAFSRFHPAKGFHLFEGFPHANEADAATGGIENGVWIFPSELFDEFVAHGFLAFDAKGFFQGGNIEPTFFVFALGDDATAIGDEAIDQSDVSTVENGFDIIGEGDVFGHEDVGFDLCGGGVGSQGTGGVSSRRSG